jgi:Flp pilus assembly protein TadG
MPSAALSPRSTSNLPLRINRRRTLAVEDSDRGSSVAEFAMVSVLLVLLFFSIVQVCLWIYTRNLLTAAAGDVARYAGLADVSVFDVTSRVADRLGQGLAASTKATLQCSRVVTDVMAEVRCTVDSPSLVSLLDGIMPNVTGVGHAAREAVS